MATPQGQSASGHSAADCLTAGAGFILNQSCFHRCSVNCTNDIVKLLDERIALQLEELDFEIREEGNKTNLYKMHDEYKIDLEMLSKDVN